VASVAIGQGRYQLEVDCAPAGCWVMLRGVDSSITHTATICDDPRSANHVSGDAADEIMYGDASDYGDNDDVQATFRPLQHTTKSVVRVSLEPRNPAELPRMVAALRVVCKSYPLLKSRVEESGEHVLLGTGEMHLDCALHDLRSVHSATVSGGIEIKLSDPVVSFCETVSQTSSFQCTTETPNGKNRITAVAEPLEREFFLCFFFSFSLFLSPPASPNTHTHARARARACARACARALTTCCHNEPISCVVYIQVCRTFYRWDSGAASRECRSNTAYIVMTPGVQNTVP
jgi:translation elongation factor EF-G